MTGLRNALPRLYVIRHGETAWSLSGQHTGRTDIPLNEQGEHDARKLAEQLHAVRFHYMFAVLAAAAGSMPSGKVHPIAIDMLRNLNYDTSKLRSKPWDEFAKPGAPQLDFVFTVCDNAANEVCPIWPGQPVSAHWGLPDPSAATGTETERALAFADAHRMLYQRISIFTNLPLSSLDKLSLQKRLEDIGKTKADVTREKA